MFEIFKIRYCGRQPTAAITSATLDKLIQRDYPGSFSEVKQKLNSIKSDNQKGRNRLSAAVLKLSNCDLANIEVYIEMCNHDFRDIVSQAEYPRIYKLGFGEFPSKKLKEAYMADWQEYSNWLHKN